MFIVEYKIILPIAGAIIGMAKCNILYAFHDFRVTWPSFDYFGFLITAEWSRRKIGADKLHIVFVPQPDDQFHEEFDYDLNEKKWRLNNIIIPACWLLPSCSGVSVCGTLEHAKEIFDGLNSPIFPEGYTIEKPIVNGDPSWPALLANMGINLSYLVSTTQALKYISSWMEIHSSGKKVITLTLRNSKKHRNRNSDLGLWSEISHWLKDSGYFPVIVPDTDAALEPLGPEFLGITSIPSVSFNLELRMALYEESFLNLFVSNGPAYICCFNKNAHFIQFRTGDFLTNPMSIQSFQGIPYGSNPPYLNHFQKSVWQELSLTVVKEEVGQMEAFIQTSIEDNSYELKLEPNPENREPVSRMLKRFSYYKNWEPFNAAASWLLENDIDKDKDKDKDKDDVWYEILMADLVGKADESYVPILRPEKYVEIAQLLINSFQSKLQKYEFSEYEGFAKTCFQLGKIHEATGNHAYANSLYRKIMELENVDPELIFRLGMTFVQQNELDSAIKAFERLISSGFNRWSILECLSMLYQKVGKPKEALVYKKLSIEQKLLVSKGV